MHSLDGKFFTSWVRGGEESFSRFIPLHKEFLHELLKWDVAFAGHYRCSKYLWVVFCARKHGSLLWRCHSLEVRQALKLPRVKWNVSVTFPNNVTANDLPFFVQSQFVSLETVKGADRTITVDRISWLSVLVSWYLRFLPFAVQGMKWSWVLTYNLSSFDTSLSWTGQFVSEWYSRWVFWHLCIVTLCFCLWSSEF